MTTDLVPSFVDPEVSAAIQISERLKPLKDALGIADLTPQEIDLFAMVAHHTGLDPFTRQIYAVKRAGKVVHQTGIDGYRSIAESKGQGQYAGSDEATFEACDCGQAPADHPKIARVVVHRILPSGYLVDQIGIARWHELYPGSGNDGFMWRQMPHNQLSKCAEANGLRKAFPRVLGGVYITEEMQQADTIEGTARVVEPPTVRERIAARRAEVEAPKQAPAQEGGHEEAPARETPAAETQPSDASPVSGEADEPEPDAIAPSGEMTAAELLAKARDQFKGTTQIREAAIALFDDRPPSAFRGEPATWSLDGAEWYALAVDMGLVE